MRQVAAWHRFPARPGRYGAFPPSLDRRLVAMLRSRGIERLYSHQATAVAAALRGEQLAVVTPTASGKTLCYNLPVLHTLLNDPTARALYLFPTKALAQDQLAELDSLLQGLEAGGGGEGPSADRSIYPLHPATYDGDTPRAERPRIRRSARLLITNPDMLHTGILPHHTGASSARTWPMCCAACGAFASSMVHNRNSSAVRRPSPIPRSTPSDSWKHP